MNKHNGHKNFNHWNVSLWINNDEGLYNLAKQCLKDAKACDCRKQGESVRDLAAKMFLCRVDGDKTPDGVTYSITTIKAAIAGIE